MCQVWLHSSVFFLLTILSYRRWETCPKRRAFIQPNKHQKERIQSILVFHSNAVILVVFFFGKKNFHFIRPHHPPHIAYHFHFPKFWLQINRYIKKWRAVIISIQMLFVFLDARPCQCICFAKIQQRTKKKWNVMPLRCSIDHH